MREFFWDFFDSWEQAENAWDQRAKIAAHRASLDIPKINPSIPQIAPETKRFLRFKALSWVLQHDSKGELRRFFFNHPGKHIVRYVQSLFRRTSFLRDEDLFFYGVKNISDIHECMRQEDTIVLVGFSYCEKPKECPAIRFSNACIADEEHPVCQQCFIGKVRHALPAERTIFAVVPTINAIGEEVLHVIKEHNGKKIIFLIASCEMALTMFGDLGNMVGIKGIGIKLDGRICNTMKAFSLSEQGIKPGMTWLSPTSERKMLDLVRFWREEALRFF